MKRFLYLLLAAMMLASCEQNKVRIELPFNVLTLTVGDEFPIKATVTGTTNAVSWTTSNPEVALVVANIIIANGEGQAQITATVDGYSASCTIIVENGGSDNPAGKLPLNKSMVYLETGKTFQLQASGVDPATVSWKSANTNLATVSTTGLVKAISDGTVEIIAKSGNREGRCTFGITQQGGIYHGDYKLVWADEFDGNELDLNNWTIEVNGNGGGNGESQYYTNRAKNIRVEDGCLVIEAHKESYSGKEYTSGRINSNGKHNFRYCKAEARMWLPKGRGTWPAFWMLGNRGTWPSCGEIDIMEHVGNDPKMTSHALHTREGNGNNGKHWNMRVYSENSMEESWHIYTVEWIEQFMFGRDAIRFSVDGKVSTFVTEPSTERDAAKWPFYNDGSYDNRFYIIFNLALGGWMGGTIDNNMFNNPVIMKVDWVRVYQTEY